MEIPVVWPIEMPVIMNVVKGLAMVLLATAGAVEVVVFVVVLLGNEIHI